MTFPSLNLARVRAFFEGLWMVVRVALGVALIFVSVAVWQVLQQTRQTEISVQQTLAHINAVTDTVNTQAAAVGSEAHRVLLEAGLTAATARKASEEQRVYWSTQVPILNRKAQQLLDNANALMVSLKQTSDGLNSDSAEVSNQAVATLKAAQPALENSAEALKQAAATASAATQFISDPNLKSTVQHLDQGAANLATATQALAGTARDIQGEVHGLTHPTVFGRIKSGFLFALETFEKFAETRYYF